MAPSAAFAVVSLVMLGLLAGCLAPQDGVEEHRLDSPATLECGQLSVHAPEEVRVGEGVEVTARLQNVCDEPFQVQGTSGSCSPSGLNVRLLHGEDVWFLSGAAAVPMRACTADMPLPRTVEPGGELVETFRWNGTFDTSFCPSARCPVPPQPPADLVVEAYVVRPDEGFIAQTDVRYVE